MTSNTFQDPQTKAQMQKLIFEHLIILLKYFYNDATETKLSTSLQGQPNLFELICKN